MKNAFILLFISFLTFSLKSQIVTQICEVKTDAVLEFNRNEFLHTFTPPSLNTGYQHDFPVPTAPTSPCPVELTGITVDIQITNLFNDLNNVNSTNGTACALAGWFIDIFYNCPTSPGTQCQLVQQVNGGCNSFGTPITGIGQFDLELLNCNGSNPPANFNTLNIDVVPAMDYANPSTCPGIAMALPNGWIDIEYTLCVDFEYTVLTPPNPTVSNTGPYCTGDEIELFADGGNTYQWVGPDNFNSNQQNPTINNATALNAGTYTVTVSTGPGCEAVEMIEVEVAELSTTVFDQGDPTCFLGDDGFADLVTTGGDGPYEYDWSPGGFTGSFVDELEAFEIYDITITDDNGCEEIISFGPLDEPDAVEVDLSNSQNPTCSAAADGSATFTPSGGNGPPYNIIWSNGGFTTFTVNTLLANTTYDVTVTDVLGCEGFATVRLDPGNGPNISFSPISPFCPENMTVALTATPSGGTWSGSVTPSGFFNPSTLGPGVHNAIYTIGGICVARDTLEITVLPTIQITFGDSVFCENITSATLTATPPGGLWSGSGISPTGEIDPSTLAAGTHIFTYDITDPVNSCTNSRNLTVTIEQPSSVTINGNDNFCQTDGIQTYTAMPTGGTWSGIANASGEVDPSTLTVGAHIITYTVTVGTCTSSNDFTINIAEPPTGTISGGGNLCMGGNSAIDLNLTGTGPWMVTLALDGIPQVPITIGTSPSQQSVGQGGTYTIVSITDASGCVGTGTGSAVVTPIPPLLISNIQTQCDATNTTFVLTFEISGGDPATYQVTGVAGTLTGNIFTSQSIPQGILTNFTVSDGTGCSSISDNVTVNCACTTAVGTMDLNTIEICGTGTATATYDNSSENLDGNDIIQFVLHDASGANLGNILGTSMSPSFDLNPSLMFGVTYYISAIAGNNDGNGNVELTDNCLQVAQGTPVIFQEIPTVTLSGDNTICAGESADLVFTLTGSPPWNIQYSDGINTFDLNGITTSSFTLSVMPTATTIYTAASVANNSCPGTVNGTVTITVNIPPTADVTTTASVCNSSQSGDLTTFDFSDLIISGDDTGFWTDVDGSGAAGTLPNLDFETIIPGDYTFRYTTNSAMPPCNETSFEVTLTVRDCSCPSVVTTGAGPFCNDDAMFNLTSITTTTEAGTWAVTSAPSGATNIINGNIFDATGLTDGDYVIEFTLDNPVMGCPSSSTQTIQVFAPPTADVTTTASVCNSSQSGDLTTFDFSDLIISGDDTGFWTDVDGSGAAGTLPNLDFENITPGDYTFTYTTASAMLPCSEASFDVTITVRDCNCPSVQTTTAGPFCNDDARLDLTTITTTTESGTWAVTSAPSGATNIINGNIFDATRLPDGDYVIEFTLDNPINGCPSTSTQTIQISAAPNSGDLVDNLQICEGIDTIVSLFDLIVNNDVGSWTDVSLNPIVAGFDAASGTLTTSGITPDTYTFQHFVAGDGVCADASTTVEITINETPTADAGMDVEIDCDATAVSLGGASTIGTNIQYSWMGDVTDPNAATTSTSTTGTFILTVRNEDTGCSDTDEVIVTPSINFPSVVPSVMDATCAGFEDGAIQVGDVMGGQMPYLFSLNGTAFSDQTNFSDLPAGNYTLIVEDATGCRDSVDIEIAEPAPITVNLSASQTLISTGDSVVLTANTTANSDSVIWSPAGAFNDCTDCFTQTVFPDGATTYTVRIIDEDGCTASASTSVSLQPSVDLEVFVPSAFSPNNDGINDIFLPFVGSRVARINFFFVYDRWGEPVHQVSDVAPNDLSAGWDGTFRGKLLNTSVFVWTAEVEYIDGTIELFEGDVTMLK